jgi:hypothetical protein
MSRAARAGVLGLACFLLTPRCSSNRGNADSGTNTDGGRAGEVTLKGAVSKGPFILGSPVVVSGIDSAGNPTGQSFPTEITDNFGDYTLDFDYSGPALLSANGYYFNEITGGLSASSLTLEAYAQISGSSNEVACINIVTQLTHDRVKGLLSAGSTISSASSQAEAELQAALGIGGVGFDAGTLAIQENVLGGDTNGNAYLLAVSAVFARAALDLADGGPSDALLQSLINTIALGFADSGQIDPATTASLQAAEQEVEPDALMAALSSYFGDAGVPNVNRTLDSDLDGIPNLQDNCPLVYNPLQQPVNGVCSYEKLFLTAPTDGTGDIVSADFNNDGKTDIATTTSTTNIRVFLSNGKGGLAYASDTNVSDAGYVLGGFSNGSFAGLQAADIDNDGILDLIGLVGSNPPTYVWLRGDGMGNFRAPSVIPALTDTYCFPMAIGDLNGDGVTDVVTCAVGADGYSHPFLYPGLGGGQFGVPQPIVLPATDAGAGGVNVPVGFLVGDLNHDGRPDLISLAWWSFHNTAGFDDAFVNLATSDGGLIPWAVVGPYDGAPFENATLGDVDGDGNLDLLIVSWGYMSMVYFGDGSGNFPNELSLPTIPEPVVYGGAWSAPWEEASAILDVTGNGKGDVFIATATGPQVFISDGRSLEGPVSIVGSSLPPGGTAGGMAPLALPNVGDAGFGGIVFAPCGQNCGGTGATPMTEVLINPPGYRSW